MSSWNRIQLGAITESVDYGVTASAAFSNVGPKFLRITDIQNGSVDWSSVPWCLCEEKELQASRLKAGDIVFARTGATTGKSYLINDCPSDSVFASYLIRVRVNAGVEPRFISHFFKTEDYWAQISKGARGAAQPGVNATTLKALQVPLPALPVQRRIAAILDKADALRQKRREALTQLDCLAQSIFVEMFGDPATRPKKWPVANIGNLLESASYGTSEKSGTSGQFPVLRMNNITRTGDMDFADLKYMDLDESEYERYLVKPGDVLFNRTNSAELVGKTAIFRQAEPMAYAGYLIRLRTNPDNDPEYLAAFMNTPYTKRVLRSMCKSIIGMANINATEVQSIKVARPPLALQVQFRQRIESLNQMKARHRAHLVELDGLFSSLQQRAFQGEL